MCVWSTDRQTVVNKSVLAFDGTSASAPALAALAAWLLVEELYWVLRASGRRV